MPDAPPAIAISQITTLTAAFADDVATHVAAGADGIAERARASFERVWEARIHEQMEQVSPR